VYDGAVYAPSHLARCAVLPAGMFQRVLTQLYREEWLTEEAVFAWNEDTSDAVSAHHTTPHHTTPHDTHYRSPRCIQSFSSVSVSLSLLLRFSSSTVLCAKLIAKWPA
jgi:hypothetical protein